MDKIDVMPNIKLNGRDCLTTKRPVDPDVTRVQQQQQEEEVNIFSGGQTTKEEKENEKENEKEKEKEKEDGNPNSCVPWLIIGLAVIVVILMVVVAWYVLKENKKSAEEKEKRKLPPDVLQPGIQPGAPNQYYRHYVNPSQVPTTQTERMPVQTKTMEQNNVKTPSKQELEQTLSKLSSIKEEPVPELEDVIRPSKAQKEKEARIVEVENEDEDEDEGEDESNYTDPENESKLAKTFYSDLQQNIDSGEEDVENTD